MEMGWGLEGIYVGAVVGFRVEVGAEVGKGWLGLELILGCGRRWDWNRVWIGLGK